MTPSSVPLTDGSVFTTLDFPSNASVLADAAAGAESVRLVLNGPGGQVVDRVENVAPYSLFANNGADFFGSALEVGSYTLSVTAYTGDGATGTAGDTLTVGFTIVPFGIA